MTIQDSETIDLFHIDSVTGEAVLTIVDHLEWDPELEHLLLLQTKINSYLRFIESEDLLQSFPSAKGRAVLIQLVCKYQPDHIAKGFLDKASDVVKHAGFNFKCQQRE